MNFKADLGSQKKYITASSGTRAYAMATLNKRKLVTSNLYKV